MNSTQKNPKETFEKNRNLFAYNELKLKPNIGFQTSFYTAFAYHLNVNHSDI